MNNVSTLMGLHQVLTLLHENTMILTALKYSYYNIINCPGMTMSRTDGEDTRKGECSRRE